MHSLYLVQFKILFSFIVLFLINTDNPYPYEFRNELHNHFKQAADISFTVSGQYLDKKDSAMANADVEVFNEGLIIGSDITGEDGSFAVQALITNVEEPEQFIQENYLNFTGANPFSYETSFESTIKEQATARVFGLDGKLVDQINLKGTGTHSFTWGGQNRQGQEVAPGAYIVNVAGANGMESAKTVFAGNGSSRLVLENYRPLTENQVVELKSIMSEVDSLKFTKNNTTKLWHPFEHDYQDIDVGIIEGNPGPVITEDILDTVAPQGDTLSWYFFNQGYNDEETNDYEASGEGTWIGGDSLYHIVQSTQTNVIWDVTDLTDPELSTQFNFYVSPSGGGNQPPVAEDDTASVDEDNTVVIDVLDNDYDPDGNLDPGSVDTTDLLAPSHGEITNINDSTGHITYEPNTNYYGTDKFEYRVSDSLELSDVGLVEVTVNSVNDPPNANDDEASTPYETAVTIDVVANDTDIDGNIDPTTVDTTDLLAPSHGTITEIDDATGKITYDPDNGFSGDDEFEYLVYDDGTPAKSDTALVTVQVADPSNSPPVAVDDTASVDEDNTVVIDVLDNDYDPDGNLDPGSVDTTDLLAPSHGEITNINDSTGHITYEPNTNYYGTDKFEYRVSDSLELSDVGLVEVTVNSVNDPPNANDDEASTPYETAVTIDVVANDTDIDGNIDPTTVDTTGLLAPSNGTITEIDDVTGEMTYEPDTNWNGTDNFEYVVWDDGTPSLSDTALVTVNVAAVNDAPYEVTPINDPQTINEDNSWVYTVRPTNVDDVDSPTLSYTLDNVVNGDYSVSGDQITITPNPDWNGTIADIIINASDGQYTTPMTPYDLEVKPVPDAPVAVDDSDSTNEDVPVTIDVLANDYDVDGDLDSTSVENTDLLQPGNGSISINGENGEITYTPDLDWNGSDSFEYRVYDLTDSSDVALVNVTVKAINDAPVANTDNETTDYETSVLIPASSNDTDVDGNIVDSSLQINLSGLVNFSNGSGTHDGNGNVNYTPDDEFSGADSAQYIISDDGYPPPAKSDTGWMHVTVNENTTDVLFECKQAETDSSFNSGTFTLYYKKDGWTEDSVKTSSTSYITLSMIVGETYQLGAEHSNDWETDNDYPKEYTFIKRNSDLEAFDQKDYDDQDMEFVVQNNDTIFTYKLKSDFDMYHFLVYAVELGGIVEGIRKFDKTNGPDAPFWVDTSDGGQKLTETQEEWYNEMVNDLNSVPHVYTEFPLQQNANEPSDPHHRCSIDEDNPPTPLNGTSFNSNHEITQSYAMYPLTFSENGFKQEFFEAIGDLNDIGGSSPKILNGSSEDYTLNNLGRDIFAVISLSEPGTKLKY